MIHLNSLWPDLPRKTFSAHSTLKKGQERLVMLKDIHFRHSQFMHHQHLSQILHEYKGSLSCEMTDCGVSWEVVHSCCSSLNMPLNRALALYPGNADGTCWQAARVFNDCNVPLARTVIPGVKRGAKCFFYTSNNSRSEMSTPNSLRLSDSTIPMFYSKVGSFRKTVQANTVLHSEAHSKSSFS